VSLARATSLRALRDGDLTTCRIDGTAVVVARIGDVVRAFEDRCPHLGVALSEGRLEDGVLTCGGHHYEFDVASGRGLNPRTVRLRCFRVAIDGDDVLVDPAEVER
jgi:nitrite reductase/ring-hydroxylating ferredoxin subunit